MCTTGTTKRNVKTKIITWQDTQYINRESTNAVTTTKKSQLQNATNNKLKTDQTQNLTPILTLLMNKPGQADRFTL